MAPLPFTTTVGSRPQPDGQNVVETAGSRRRRLWELGACAHCPVIGVCLPIDTLRRLACKVTGLQLEADDHALHSALVGACRTRSPMADALQRELDRRYLPQLRHAASVTTAEALTAWWLEPSASHRLPGALWATLTHPRCTPALQHQVLGQVHMLQHPAGMVTRQELARIEALIEENAVLARSLANAQQRGTRLAKEHAERVDMLQAEVMRQRGQRMAADSRLARLQQDFQALHQSVPDLQQRSQLALRVTQQAERIAGLQQALQAARGREAPPPASPPPAAGVDAAGADTARPAATAAATHAMNMPGWVSLPEAHPATPTLADCSVLCVGGRRGSVPVYRRWIEACGGRFLHHDGGAEQSASQLESTLAAADLVICQTGCVSHNAYWRVKDHCKRTGKRCVFVAAPSAANLQRALADIGAAP